MWYRIYFLLCMALFLSLTTQAQTARYYQQWQSDTLSVRFEGAYRLALAYRRTQQDSARFFASKVADLLPQLDSIQRIQAYAVQGLVAYEAGAYEEALSFFAQAEQEARRQNNPKEKARNLSRQGNAYTMLGQTPQAIAHYQQAIELAEREHMPRERVYFLQALAFCYQKTGSPEKAIPYFEDALAYFKNNQDWAGVISTQNLLHIAWSNMDSLDRALDLLKSNLSPPLAQHLSAKDSATVLHNLGRLYNMQGQYEVAGQALRQAMTIKQRQDNPESTLKSWIEWVTSLKAQGNYDEAYAVARQLDTGTLNNSSIYTQRDYYRHLSEIMAQRGVYAKAYRYHEVFDSLDQVIFNQENRKSVAELELQLAQQENARLASQKLAARRQRNWALLSGLLLAGLVGSFLFFRQRELQLQKKWADQQLAQQEKQYRARTQFFMNISHELRTPLTLIQSPAKSLLQQAPTPQQKELAHIILRNTQEMNYLIEQTLHLERIQDAQIPLSLSPVNLQRFLEETVRPFHQLAEEKSQGFTFSHQVDHDWVRIDPVRTRHILRNLLSNAFKFTPSGKTISLATQCKKGQLAIIVQDDGPGIAPHDLPHIFERHYRGRQNTHATPSGSGIGLHLARELARQQQGELTVQSRPGQGSTFTCSLPWLPVDSPAKTVSPSPSRQASPSAPVVLLVEDNTEMRNYLFHILSPHYQLLQAGNGQEALSMLQSQESAIDLILSDVMMPELDGFGLVQAVKENDQLAGIPIILLTARSEPRDKLNALTAGVSDYINKPFLPEELKLRIEKLVEYKTNRPANPVGEDSTDSPSIISQQQWLQEVESVMLERLDDPDFSIKRIAQALHISERQFFRRIKQITGLTPNHYWREVRLKEARRMLEEGACATVAEISFAVGFQTPEYFSKIFKERYGITPSEVLHGR